MKTFPTLPLYFIAKEQRKTSREITNMSEGIIDMEL